MWPIPALSRLPQPSPWWQVLRRKAPPSSAKQPAEIAVIVEEGIGIADCQHDVNLAQPVQPPVRAEAWQKMRRRVVIDAVVVIAVEQIAEGFHFHRQIVAPGKGDELAEEMRMAEDEARRLESAEAAPMHDSAAMRVLRRHQRQHLVEDIVLQSGMPANTLGRMAVETVKAVCRQALDAIKLEMAGLQFLGKARDQAELLIFEKAPFPRRKNQHLGAGMAENQHLHVSMQTLTVPAEIFAVHGTLKNGPILSRRAASCSALSG